MGKNSSDHESYGATDVGSAVHSPKGDSESLHSEELPGRRQIGLVSAVFIIFNRMIGTG